MMKQRRLLFELADVMRPLILLSVTLALVCMSGCGGGKETVFNKDEHRIIVTFDNNPLSKPTRPAVVFLTFDQLGIPLEKIYPQVEEYYHLLQQTKKEEQNPDDLLKIIEIKSELLEIITKNISPSHRRKNGLPIDISIT